MRAESQPTAQHMMLDMNFWSALFLSSAILVSGEGINFIHFVSRHPVCLGHISALALAGALGQLFIFITVSTCLFIFQYENHTYVFIVLGF